MNNYFYDTFDHGDSNSIVKYFFSVYKHHYVDGNKFYRKKLSYIKYYTLHKNQRIFKV